MTPAGGARRRALRALLAAVAGGGLTAAALGGPLTTGATAGEATTGEEGTTSTTSASETTTTTPTEATTTTESSTPSGSKGGGGEASSTTTTSTTTTNAPAPGEATTSPGTTTEEPTVVLKPKRTTPATKTNPNQSSTEGKNAKEKNGKAGTGEGEGNIAESPGSVSASNALAAVLASSQASAASLDFYRIPLFLLPIYKAAAVQYGVPWQILAAINEIETDYGTDQAVSSAGAVGWMQFMPETWLQYGVDALNAGYADPYNPVDAVFAAARYLRAAGAATNLRGAILAYNHSEEYASSVLLRAKLISTYPKPVVATLTGLVDGRLPVSGHQLAWTPAPGSPATAASAAGESSEASGSTEGSSSATAGAVAEEPTSPTTATSAPDPTAAAAGAGKKEAAKPLFDELTTGPKASVVAVEDGKVIKLGHSAKLGDFLVMRDVYGDVFTYAGLGSLAKSYLVPKETDAQISNAIKAASSSVPAPSKAASAGVQPQTLQVTPPSASHSAADSGQVAIPDQEAAPAGMNRRRLFAHPGNPDAKAAARLQAERNARRERAGQRERLERGSVVPAGTVLGKVSVDSEGKAGHLRFSIRPEGDAATIEPGPILTNWGQLQRALHPRGAKAKDALLGATASEVFLLSKPALERTVLSDPSIQIYACGRQDIASGAIDSRVLALLAFLARSGLAPTVSSLRCGQSEYGSNGSQSAAYRGQALAITAINGVPIARHQGAGTITDLTIRTLLTLPSEFVPHQIISLMRYPASANTSADKAYWNRIYIAFAPKPKRAAVNPLLAGRAAHSASKGATAPAPVVTTATLTNTEWTQLIERIGGLPMPKVSLKPSSSAVADKPAKKG